MVQLKSIISSSLLRVRSQISSGFRQSSDETVKYSSASASGKGNKSVLRRFLLLYRNTHYWSAEYKPISLLSLQIIIVSAIQKILFSLSIVLGGAVSL